MKRPKIIGWGNKLNENDVIMAELPRDLLVETIKYIDHIEKEMNELIKENNKLKLKNQELAILQLKSTL